MNGIWLVTYVLLWATVLGLSFAVVALLRQIGVLHTRIAPMASTSPDPFWRLAKLLRRTKVRHYRW